MTAADSAANPLLDMACPDCSFLRSRHRELLEDVLIFPTILHAAPREGVRYRDGKYRIIGCPHVRSVFGPHDTQEAAQQAVRECFAGMRQNPYGHTMQEQSRAAGETPGDGEAQPGEADGGTAQEGAAEVSQGPSGLPGEDAAAVACQVGSNIWAQHQLGIDGKCERCGFVYPELNL